ncbi:hypothetical protein [Streptomyces sp. NPDC056154]|uniref:hypothetical protein n=1 Tax=unclassified Streptomyces TaxID=2593676 RepID=UPI0035D52F79
MGYASYEVLLDGKKLNAGYSVEAECDKDGCAKQIDRGLAYLCGQTPGGDEYGCGHYFCADHLLGSQQCEACAKKADEANTWTNPATGNSYDLRDQFLPPGETYRPDGWVWKHLGTFEGDVPVLVPVKLPDLTPGGHSGCAITAYDFEIAGSVAWRQQLADQAETAKAARNA